MKILYLLYFNIDDKNQLGISKKIKSQIKAMSELGNEVVLAYCKDDELILNKNGKKLATKKAKYGKTHYRKALMKLIPALVEDYDLLYIRYPASIDYFVYLTIKRASQKCKVVLEMPTYPIGGELVNFLKTLRQERKYLEWGLRGAVYASHVFFSRRLNNYLLCIVSFSNCDEIWGNKVINIENGIDCSAIRPKKEKKIDGKHIRLLFVAVFAPWHGLDRLIDGLKDYYANKTEDMPDFTISLVGESEELKKQISRPSFSSIKDRVEICGKLYGEDLDAKYDEADIAISSLGMHRIGLEYGSTLKTREYCAKGIPFLIGYKEKQIDESFPYVLKIPATDEPVSFYSIIDFVNQIRNKNIIEEMRSFSYRFDWKNQIDSLFQKLESLEQEHVV